MEDKLGELLNDGWNINGYSVCITAGGSLVHNILLRKEHNVEVITVVKTGDNEDGRKHHVFVPAPEKKKGWFG